MEEVVERALNGDKEAMETLVNLLKPLIISSSRRYGGLRNYDEDAYGEGVVVILEGIREFDQEKGIPFLGYIKTRMKHYYQNRRRKYKALYSLDEPVDKDGNMTLLDTIVDKSVDIAGDCIDKDEVIHMKKAINSLTDIQREIIVDYYLRKLTLKEIAKKRNVHLVTVAKIKATALKKLRKKLENIC